jgi:hypothetical protein
MSRVVRAGWYVASWHEACVRPGAFKGTETAALPTLAAERRVIDAFQT